MSFVAVAGSGLALPLEESSVGIDALGRIIGRAGPRRRRLDNRRIDQRAALEHQSFVLDLSIHQRQQFDRQPRLVQPFAKPAQCRVVGGRFFHPKTDKPPKRQPIAQRLFQLAIRKSVPLRQQQGSEHHHRRERRATVLLAAMLLKPIGQRSPVQQHQNPVQVRLPPQPFCRQVAKAQSAAHRSPRILEDKRFTKCSLLQQSHKGGGSSFQRKPTAFETRSPKPP